MIPRSLALGLLAAGCVVAAGGGAYVAVRQNAAEPAPAVAAHAAPAAAQQAVSETEALIAPPAPAPTSAEVLVEEPTPAKAPTTSRHPESASRREGTRNARTAARQEPSVAPTARSRPPTVPSVSSPVEQPPSVRDSPPPALPPVEPVPEPPRYVELAAVEPQFEEVTVPASAVIGLQIETPLSSERAQLEDRVSARVTRDVMSRGRVAIPAGSRVLGSVTLVEKGGKVKERARLGVRFHTLVLADGSELPVRTEAIFREGASPAADSSRKIGGAAVGGAVLGAILGGGKGAVIGGATGAAGGTAVVMAGDRHAATLPNGTIVTVRLTSPVDVQVERD